MVKGNVQECWCALSQYGGNLLYLSKAYLSFFCVQNTVTNDEYLSAARYKLLTILTRKFLCLENFSLNQFFTAPLTHF